MAEPSAVSLAVGEARALLQAPVINAVALQAASRTIRQRMSEVTAVASVLTPAHAKILDVEATELWNALLARRSELSDALAFASTRYAAAVVICSSNAVDSGDKGILRNLELLLKAVRALLAASAVAEAEEALVKAAELIEKLEMGVGVDGLLVQKAGNLTACFYGHRADLALRQNKLSVADFSLHKVVEDAHIGSCNSLELLQLASHAVTLGERLALQQGSEAQGRSTPAFWARTAIKLIERLPSSPSRHVLNSQALEMLVSGATATADPVELDAASAALSEIMKQDASFSRHRQNIRLCVLAAKEDAEIVAAFITALNAIADERAADDCLSLLREIHRVPEQRIRLRIRILRNMLQGCLARNALHNAVGKVLMAIARTAGERDFDAIADAFAVCQTYTTIRLDTEYEMGLHFYLWRQADRMAEGGKLDEAIRWYTLSTLRPPFQDTTQADKACRRIAICHLRRHDFAAAEDAVRKCNGASAASATYVRFLVSTLRGDVSAAVHELQLMVKAEGFKVDMLMWAVQQASECEMEELIEAATEALYEVATALGGKLDSVDPMVLVRCALRLRLAKRSSEAATITSILPQLQTALSVLRESVKNMESPTDLVKEFSWLVKVAWNELASQQNRNDDRQTVALADVTGDLLELLLHAASADGSSPVVQQLLQCRQLALKVGAAHLKPEEILQRLTSVYTIVGSEALDELQHGSLMRTEFRAACAAGEQPRAVEVIKKACALTDSEQRSKVLQSFAYTLCQRQAFELDSHFHLIDLVIEGMLDTHLLDIPAFARWIRLLIECFADAGHANHAAQHARSAVELLKRSASSYPAEDAQWLVAYTWELGVDAKNSGDIDQAQVWCSLALSAAPHVRDGAAMLSPMQTFYKALTAARDSLMD